MPVKAKSVGSPLRRPRLDEDVIPYTECRRTLADCMAKTRRTHRPILITQNGRATSYLVDATDFDALMDSIELSRDVEISRREFAEGKGIPLETVSRNVLAALREHAAARTVQ